MVTGGLCHVVQLSWKTGGGVPVPDTRPPKWVGGGKAYFQKKKANFHVNFSQHIFIVLYCIVMSVFQIIMKALKC